MSRVPTTGSDDNAGFISLEVHHDDPFTSEEGLRANVHFSG
jgi:hypothetical protein